MGRFATQNTSHINVTSHKGSKELCEVFVFCNQTPFHAVEVSVLRIELHISIHLGLQSKIREKPDFETSISAFLLMDPV